MAWHGRLLLLLLLLLLEEAVRHCDLWLPLLLHAAGSALIQHAIQAAALPGGRMDQQSITLVHPQLDYRPGLAGTVAYGPYGAVVLSTDNRCARRHWGVGGIYGRAPLHAACVVCSMYGIAPTGRGPPLLAPRVRVHARTTALHTGWLVLL